MRIACFLGIFLLATVTAAGQTLVLCHNGAADYVLQLPEEPTPTERRGAEELQRHLKLIGGAELPIRESATPAEKCIQISQNPQPDPAQGPESFRISTQGARVVIVGNGPRGVMYGCSALLETLGVRWYTPKVTRFTARSTIELPAMDQAESPAFEYREPFFFEAFDKDWAARLRTNGSHARLDESVGGRIIYHPFVHTFDELVPEKLFKSNPDYFPLIKGKRTGGYVQRCLSNPEVLRISIDCVRRWIAEHPQATIFSVSQNDTGKWCECDECTRIANQCGGRQSGLYLWFVNSVAEVIETDHPDKLIDTLAYQFTEAPPEGIVPRRNVRVRLCPIAVCEAHPYEKCADSHTVAFIRHLAAWSRITDTLYIWHYNTNFANYLMPFPDFDEFPADLRLYKRSGVKGIFFQGAYAQGGGGSDSELRAYVMAKLLWNPSLDSDALVNEWMEGVYGAAKPPMRRWFDLLHERARRPENHFFIYSPPTVAYLADDVLKAGDELFDQAEALAAGDAVAVEYVAKSRLGLRYVKLVREQKGDPQLSQFLADAKRFGVTELREGQPIDRWEADYRKNLPK